MTTRDDIRVNFIQSPRIVIVDAPSTEFLVQDIVDTLRVEEATFQGIAYPHLLDASGKADLGGGVFTGITVELQNAQIAFEPRLTPTATGTATSTSTSSLIDASATFVTDGIIRGATVRNRDSEEDMAVLEVVSETELTLTQLALFDNPGGFTSGDAYDVHNQILCQVRGGNLVAVDDVAAAINPIMGTPFIFAQLELSSSATLLQPGQLDNILKVLVNRTVLTDGDTANFVIYDDDDTTPLYTHDVTDPNGNAIVIGNGVPAERTRGV